MIVAVIGDARARAVDVDVRRDTLARLRMMRRVAEHLAQDVVRSAQATGEHVRISRDDVAACNDSAHEPPRDEEPLPALATAAARRSHRWDGAAITSWSTNSCTIASQNDPTSAGTRLDTQLRSATTGSSSHVSPALVTSSAMPGHDVSVRPCTMPAEIISSGP